MVVYITYGNEFGSVRVADHATAFITTGPFTNGGSRDYDFVVSPNGAYVAYIKGSGSAIELWLAATDDSANRKLLTTDSTQLHYLSQAHFSPNGSYLLFPTSPTNATELLFSVASAGNTTPVELNSAPFKTFYVATFVLSPDSSSAIYTQVLANTNHTYADIYSVAIGGSGSASIKLNQIGTSTFFYGPPVISPNSQRVVLPDAGFYSMDLQGGNRVQLSPAGAVSALAISAESTRIVYGWQNGNTTSGEFYVVPINGPMSASVQVITVPRVETPSVNFTADGSRVVATVFVLSSSLPALYSAPIQGPVSASVMLADGAPVHIGIDYNRPTTHVIFTPPNSGVPYIVPVVGPAAAAQLITPNGNSGSVTLNGQRYVYSDANQIFSVPIGGPLSATRNETLLPVGRPVLNAYQVASDSSRLTFSAGNTLYTKTLGTGSLVASLLPECQSTPAAAGPTATPNPLLTPQLFLPALQRCAGY